MNLLDQIRPAEVQHFGGVFAAAPVALKIKRALLKVGAHRAVKNDDAPADQIEKG